MQTEDKVDTKYVVSAEGSSGIAVILVNAKSGQNTIWISAGANAYLILSKEDDVFLRTDVVMCPLEIPLSIVIEAARRTKEAGKCFILDPAPAPAEGLPNDLYTLCDWISPNEGELSTLSGVKGITDLTDEDYVEDVPLPVLHACLQLLSKGASSCINIACNHILADS